MDSRVVRARVDDRGAWGSQGRVVERASRLYAADVYGTTLAGGSAGAIATALAWMGQEKVPVVNVGLMGPPNLSLQAAASRCCGAAT